MDVVRRMMGRSSLLSQSPHAVTLQNHSEYHRRQKSKILVELLGGVKPINFDGWRFSVALWLFRGHFPDPTSVQGRSIDDCQVRVHCLVKGSQEVARRRVRGRRREPAVFQ